MTLSSLQSALLAAVLDQTQALERAEALADDAEYASYCSAARLHDLEADAIAEAQDAGLRARNLRFQLDAFAQGRADALRGFEPDVDEREVRSFDLDARAYLSGFDAGRASVAA